MWLTFADVVIDILLVIDNYIIDSIKKHVPAKNCLIVLARVQ